MRVSTFLFAFNVHHFKTDAAFEHSVGTLCQFLSREFFVVPREGVDDFFLIFCPLLINFYRARLENCEFLI